MSNRKQARKWNLTINNPATYGWTHEKLNSTLQNIASIAYYCMSDEIGEEGTYHTHIYFVTKNPKPFTTVKNFFPEAHIESANGLSSENKDYVFKEGKWLNSAKGETNLRDTHEEWGELPIERQGTRTDMLELYEMIKDGCSNVEIMEQNPKYLMHLDKIERARQNYRESLYSDKWRDIETTYIFGTTGAGKTRSVMETYGYNNVYRVCDYSHPFDSYKGQDVILFEEFRSSLPISEMLMVLDGYPVELRARYMNRVACFTKIFFCSNIDLRDQYPNVQQDEKETWLAFLRRIDNVKVFNNGTSSTFPTEIYMNEKWYFFKDGSTPTPFTSDMLDYEQISIPLSVEA